MARFMNTVNFSMQGVFCGSDKDVKVGMMQDLCGLHWLFGTPLQQSSPSFVFVIVMRG